MEDLSKKLELDVILSSDNLAEEFTENDLGIIGHELVEEYIEDKGSRAGWESMQEEAMLLAMQVEEEKTFPWPNAANVKYPLLTTAAIQFSSRAYPALVPGVNIVKGKVSGRDIDGSKMAKADRIGQHMSYQLLEEMDDWEEEMDKLCVSLPILGNMFKKTYYDSSTGTNVSELVYPRDLVVHYWAKSLETAQRVHQRLHMSDNDIYERVAAKIYLDWEDKLTKAPIEDESTQEAVHGVEDTVDVDDAYPHEVIESHCFLDLDGDGYKEPYIVTTHLNSTKVLRIVARFNEDGLFEEGGKVRKITPTQYFTKFSFVPDPDGSFYDIGFGTLLGPINETINTLINQLLDAGTLSSMQGGFISRGIRVKNGDYNFEPGEWKVVNSTGDDLRKGLVPLPVRDPSNVLFQLLGMMVESGEKLASVTDMLMGENPGQNQPATTTMTVLEQGLKVFTSIYKRMYRSLKKEYKKLFELNALYLPDESYFRVLDEGKEEQKGIAKADYNKESADVQPYADPNVASDSMKILKSQALTELLPLGTLNPMEVTKRMLEAQDQPNPEALMQQPKQGPSKEEIEQQQKQDESKRDWARIGLEREAMQITRVRSKTQSVLDLAKAEAAEIGDQLAEYEAKLKKIDQDIERKKLEQAASQGPTGGQTQQ